MTDELIEGLEKALGPMTRKPDDMPLDDFFRGMRLLNQPPFEPKYLDKRYPYVTGTIWDKFHTRRILMWVDDKKYMLLAFGRHAIGGSACLLSVQFWEDGRYLFDETELPELLKDWTCLGFWDGVEYPEVMPVPPAENKNSQ